MSFKCPKCGGSSYVLGFGLEGCSRCALEASGIYFRQLKFIDAQNYRIPSNMETLFFDGIYMNGLALLDEEYQKEEHQVRVNLDITQEDHIVGKFIDYPKLQKAVMQYVDNYKN